MPEPRLPLADLAALAAAFAARLRGAGVAVGTDRGERFARAIDLVGPRTVAELRACARATLAGDRAQQEILDRVFDDVFAGYADPTGARRGDPGSDSVSVPAPAPRPDRRLVEGSRTLSPPGDAARADHRGSGPDDGPGVDMPVLASAEERLSGRDFAELSEDELAELRSAMGRLDLTTPARRGRRTRPVPHGVHADLRATLRRAHRTGGDPLRIVRKRRRDRPRRLVVLCDISGSMQPYARAMVQLLYCAAGGRQAEVFTFATRLTRLTPVLATTSPAAALRRAGTAAPDWAGGTRIASALREFIDAYGRRGLARGAVVMIISDGWETGDPAELAAQMGRLSGLAYRIVWVNPRTASPGYRPLVGGMAAAWPHCDAVVSAHRLAALGPLTEALADPVRRRVPPR